MCKLQSMGMIEETDIYCGSKQRLVVERINIPWQNLSINVDIYITLSHTQADTAHHKFELNTEYLQVTVQLKENKGT